MPVMIDYYDKEQKHIESRRTVDRNGRTVDGPYEKYYENGQLKVKGSTKILKNGESTFVGPFEIYYENGTIKERCTYSDTLSRTKIGPFEKYFENGELEERGTYTGKEEPEFIGPYEQYGRYYEPGNWWYRGSYHGHFVWKKCTYLPDGSYDGEFEERTYQNGSAPGSTIEDDKEARIVKGTYKKGKLDGAYEERNPRFNTTVNCFYKNGVLDGEYLERKIGGGEILEQGKYKDGKKVGTWKQYGSTYEYVDGQRNGPYAEAGRNGSIEYGTYKDDKKNGEFEEVRYIKGQKVVFKKGAYKDDKLHGPFEFHDDEGIIKCTYKNGEYDGEYTEYDSTDPTKILKKCIFKDGKYDGLYEKWYDNGKPQIYAMLTGSKGYYDPWPVNGEFVSFYENGQIEEQYTAIDGKKNGAYKKYTPDGKLLVSCSYKAGKLDGDYEEHYENGQLKRKGQYKDGKEEGEHQSYYKNGVCYQLSHWKDGKRDGSFEQRDERGCLAEKCTYQEGDPIDKYVYKYYGNKRCGYINSSTKMAQKDMSTEDYWGNWSSAGRADDFYKILPTAKNLEILEIDWTNVDAEAISHCKHLKTLTIYQVNDRSSGYNFTGDDLRALGTLPELESLSISAFGLKDADMKTLHEQFPRLKNLTLSHTDVAREGAEIIDQYLPDFKITGNGYTITKESLGREHFETARIQGLIGEGYKEKFKDAVKRGNAKEAFEIMLYNGLIGQRGEVDASRWEREWDTPTSPGWGHNYLDHSNILNDIKMKDLGNGNVAFATQYESQYWHSGFDDNNSGIDYSFSGDLSVVNVDEGLLAAKPIRFDRFMEECNFEVENGEVFLKGAALPIDPPHRDNLRALLREASEPEKRKEIAEKLKQGTYKRNTLAARLTSLRKQRDKEKSTLTTRAYQKKKESTK